MKTLVFSGISAGILLSCQSSTQKNTIHNQNANIVKLSKEELDNTTLETGLIEQKNISRTLHFKGTIDVPPQNIYLLSIPLGGYLKYTDLLPGRSIKKGQIIAIMEDPQYIQLQEEYLYTRTQLSMLEKNYLRQKELYEQKAVSEKTYEQATADYESSKIKLKSLEEKLHLINIQASTLTPSHISRTINIYAPFDGFVTRVNFSIGKYIPPSEVLFELVNPDDIHLNIKVFEKDLSYLKIGQKLMAYTNHQPQKKHPCEIILINKVVNSDRSVDVHCHFDKYDENLIPGMYMQADVIVEQANTYVLPKSAILFFDNQYYVFVQHSKDEYELKPIKILELQDDNYIGIENGEELKNKKILIKNAYALLMKLKNIQEEE